MKPVLFAFGLVCAVPSAFGQWTVYDPAVHKQQILSTAQEVAKMVEMIGNQVKQLKVLQDELVTLRYYVDQFGQPGAVRPAAAGALASELERREIGLALGTLIAAIDPLAAMTDDGGGVFHAVGEKFETPAGETVERHPQLYRAIAAVQGASHNFTAVSVDTAARRAALKAQIAQTSSALARATTDAEVQKLTGTLVGLSSALQGTDQELQQATASVLVQDAANRADERRQEAARREAQAAEFSEAMEAYGERFRLMSAPVAFPTRR